MLDPIVISDLAAMPLSAFVDPFGSALDLDLRGLRCPLPVLRTRKALAGLRSSTMLRVSCTDPLASLDIPHLLRETGDVLIASERAGEAQVFLIRKA